MLKGVVVCVCVRLHAYICVWDHFWKKFLTLQL
jgi:hypothetical protein